MTELDNEFLGELRTICREIVERDLSEDEWAEWESDDEFQSPHFCGGFDGTEMEFCFSHYRPDGQERWFQFSLADAGRIANGDDVTIQFRELS